jgi:hypothetical protein
MNRSARSLEITQIQGQKLLDQRIGRDASGGLVAAETVMSRVRWQRWPEEAGWCL